jgi:hypothetical protein
MGKSAALVMLRANLSDGFTNKHDACSALQTHAKGTHRLSAAHQFVLSAALVGVACKPECWLTNERDGRSALRTRHVSAFPVGDGFP